MWKSTSRSLLGIALAVPLFLLGTQDAFAQKKPKGNDRPDPGVSVQVELTFSLGEREHITAFFATHGPEGVKPLPPGIRKNLARGKPMPPGIAKKALAPELVSLLPPRPGYEVVQVGWDVVLVEVATGLIRDVLMDVIR
jgi:hypothetical protein